MKLVGCGDSWCWGAELVDPAIDPEPIMNLPGGGFERQSVPENIKYRLKGRIVKFIISESQPDLYEYCIKLSCCNCFFGLVTNTTFISCKVTILPIGRSDSMDTKFITANQFSV